VRLRPGEPRRGKIILRTTVAKPVVDNLQNFE
jgi:hypothetical protein